MRLITCSLVLSLIALAGCDRNSSNRNTTPRTTSANAEARADVTERDDVNPAPGTFAGDEPGTRREPAPGERRLPR